MAGENQATGYVHPTGGVETYVVHHTHAGNEFHIYGRTPAEHQQSPSTPHNWESQNGKDILCPVGTPIYAVADGRIGAGGFGQLPDQSGMFQGNRLHLETSGNTFYYQHLQSFAPGIAPGAEIHAGQLLGYSGVGGDVPHLHFAAEHPNSTMAVLHDASLVNDDSAQVPGHGHAGDAAHQTGHAGETPGASPGDANFSTATGESVHVTPDGQSTPAGGPVAAPSDTSPPDHDFHPGAHTGLGDFVAPAYTNDHGGAQPHVDGGGGQTAAAPDQSGQGHISGTWTDANHLSLMPHAEASVGGGAVEHGASSAGPHQGAGHDGAHGYGLHPTPTTSLLPEHSVGHGAPGGFHPQASTDSSLGGGILHAIHNMQPGHGIDGSGPHDFHGGSGAPEPHGPAHAAVPDHAHQADHGHG